MSFVYCAVDASINNMALFILNNYWHRIKSIPQNNPDFNRDEKFNII